MSFREDAMPNETLFLLKDPEGWYTIGQIASLLRQAEAQGHTLERNSYLEKMTVRQLDNLVHGRMDC